MRILLAAAALAVATPALAQRANDNAVTSADDAFGASVGNDSVGLYGPFDVRGFSAVDAGNVRIDGLYFDRQTDLTSVVAPDNNMRVGISAQGYPLPAPTGIADYDLVRVGDRRVVSVIANGGPFGGAGGEIDAKLPLASGRFGLALGGAYARNVFETGGDEIDWSASIAADWKPTSRLELIGFYARTETLNAEAAPAVFVDGPHLPPQVTRGVFYGQSWADSHFIGQNAGLVADWEIGGGWRFKAGAFRSSSDAPQAFADLFLNTTAAGAADHLLVADRNLSFASTSGEARLSRSFAIGRLHSTLYLVARGRDQQRRYGGTDFVDLGTAVIGVPAPLPKPALSFGPQTHDSVRQGTGAIAYQGRWDDLIEFSAGLQKTSYRKTVVEPGQAPQLGRDSPWLWNVGAAVHAGSRLAFYASYATGLEEGGVAPNNAVNKDFAPPAIRTRQWDAGVRVVITPKLKFVAGVFDVRKPYYNLDLANRFRQLGEERHAGVELSLAGELAPGLNVVAGTVLLHARVSGEEVDAGRLGPIPVSTTPRTTIVAVDYQLPFLKGVSVNATATSYGRRMASSDNRLQIPSRTVLDLGARYRFKVGGAPATLRVQIGNVFNKFGWRTNPSSVFVTNAQRRVSVSLAADF